MAFDPDQGRDDPGTEFPPKLKDGPLVGQDIDDLPNVIGPPALFRD
jgi:hypothetical protein